MRNLKFFFICLGILLGFSSCIATLDASPIPYANNAPAQGTYRGSVPFIFVEQGVEFAIYPNGEFDFAYVGYNYNQNPYRNSRRAFSYNGGYNYDMYLQFDRFGAVIQVENVPIYYDYYGRILQAGNVSFRYQGDLVTQIGNMHILYERGNVYLGSSGYVNSYNININLRPWHSYYTTPYYHVIYTTPYRQNYKPVRYSYVEHTQRYNNNRGRNNYDNGRREFLDPATQAPRRGQSINSNRDTNTNAPNRGRENTTTNPREQNTNQVAPGRGTSNSSNTTTTNRREPSTSETKPVRESSTNTNLNRREQSTNEVKPVRETPVNTTPDRRVPVPQSNNQPAPVRETPAQPTQQPTRREATQSSKTNEATKPASTNTNRGRSSSSGQTSNRGR